MYDLARWLVPLMVACAPETTPAAPMPTPDGDSTEETIGLPSTGLPEVVATIGGEPITRAELLDFAGPEVIEKEIEAAEARTQAVEALIMQRLLEAEADRLGIAPEDLVKREVEDKLEPPTDEEMRAFYEENKSRINGTFEEIKPQLVGYLSQEKSTDLLRTLVRDLESSAEIERKVEPYRVHVPARNSPRWGSAEAPIQIISFSDFQCPHCTQGAATLEEVRDKYGDKVSVVYRHYPLPIHPEAGPAAAAAECANEQGRFWEFHDALFDEKKAWSKDDFVALAKQVKVKKRKKFAECLESDRHLATVDRDMQDGRKAGMTGTPGFYINGIVVVGAQPMEVFEDVIDRELARLQP